MLKLQSLTFVDRKNAYAVGGVALDGLAADGLFPLVDEGVDVRCVVLHKLVQLVIEGTQVGTLLIEAFQLEDGIEAFH